MRLFFAIWPDAPAAEALAALGRELAARADGRPVPIDKIHLTLAFLGEVAPERGAEAAAAGAPAASSFDVTFDIVGWFRGPRVAWSGSSNPAPALLRVQADLGTRLGARGFALDERPFTPHVTLARKVGRAVARAATAPISWRARELCLVRSEAGRYVWLERWPLE